NRTPPRLPLLTYTTLFRSTPCFRSCPESVQGHASSLPSPSPSTPIPEPLLAHDPPSRSPAQIRKAPGQHREQTAAQTLSWHSRRSEEHTSELQSRENLVCR